MKIKSIKEIWNDGEDRKYRTTDIQFCCDKMENKLDGIIRFAGEYEFFFDCENCLCFIENEHSYGDVSCNYHEINYCPFCGEKIEIETTEVNIEELNQERIRLQQERNILYQITLNTEEYKKIQDIDKKIREINSKI